MPLNKFLKVKIFASKDFYTGILVNEIIKSFPKNTLFYLHLESFSLNRKIKTTIILFFYTSLKKIIKNIFTILNYIITNKIIKVDDYNYDFVSYDLGIIINYPKLLRIEKYPLYNFHLGNLSNQRGSFMFFYKFLYNWSKIDLTFYKLTNEHFDVGKIVNKKSLKVNNATALDIFLLYFKNKNFIKESIKIIFKKKIKKIIVNKKKINLSPSWSIIVKTLIKKFIKISSLNIF